MKIVLAHPTGNQPVRALLRAFTKARFQIEFHTTLAVNSYAAWLELLPAAIRQEWLRRAFPIPLSQIRMHPVRELARLLLPRLGLGQFVIHETDWASVNAVYQDMDRVTAKRLSVLARRNQVNAVYACEDGALATFLRAKDLGLQCIYDLPIAYWETGRRLMQEEAERLPTWAATLGGGIRDSQRKLDRKNRELKLADVVVVPSQFVKDSLPAWTIGKKIVIAPFGSPGVKDKGRSELDDNKQSLDRPLRVLFAGSMGQRKGLGDLFAAIHLLNSPDIELVVMGSLLAPMAFYRNELSNFIYESGRPHEQVLTLMRSCDVFCLPSIIEGRALVMQEAMSQGLPLIITPNTGGSDLIEEGRTGFLVPIRSPEAIAKKLIWFLENRSEIPKMGALAQQHSAHYTWEGYGAKIVEAITDSVQNETQELKVRD